TQLVPKSGLAPADQVEAVLDQLADVLRHARTGPEKAVRLHFYAARDDVVPAIHQALAKRFTGENKPAVSIVVGAAVREGVAVSLDAVAVAGIRGVEGTVSKVLPPGWKPDREAPLAVLDAGPVFYISGQAERGKTLAESTRKTLASLDATLAFLGCSRG